LAVGDWVGEAVGEGVGMAVGSLISGIVTVVEQRRQRWFSFVMHPVSKGLMFTMLGDCNLYWPSCA
jgi:hypothetical protein